MELTTWLGMYTTAMVHRAHSTTTPPLCICHSIGIRGVSSTLKDQLETWISVGKTKASECGYSRLSLDHGN